MNATAIDNNLGKLLEEILAPAIEHLKQNTDLHRFLIQRGNGNRSRINLNGERYRYVVRDGEHTLTSERKSFTNEGPALTIKLSKDTLVYEDRQGGKMLKARNGNGSVNGPVEKAGNLFSDLFQIAFAS